MEYTNEQLDAIRHQSEEKAKASPHLVSARLEGATLIFGFGGAALAGAEIRLPAVSLLEVPSFQQAKASLQNLGEMRILPGGRAIQWTAIDVDMSALSLIQLVFNLQTLKDHQARAGATRTAAKSAAARANGAKGGRPRKVPVA